MRRQFFSLFAHNTRAGHTTHQQLRVDCSLVGARKIAAFIDLSHSIECYEALMQYLYKSQVTREFTTDLWLAPDPYLSPNKRDDRNINHFLLSYGRELSNLHLHIANQYVKPIVPDHSHLLSPYPSYSWSRDQFALFFASPQPATMQLVQYALPSIKQDQGPGSTNRDNNQHENHIVTQSPGP